jgi:hypothetical protein
MYKRSYKKQSAKKSSKRSNKRTKKVQRGGKIVLPSEYFGNSSGRYYPSGSSALSSCPKVFARSHGIVHKNGMWAGPILSPFQAGGKKKNSKKQSRKQTKKQNRKNKKGKGKKGHMKAGRR